MPTPLIEHAVVANQIEQLPDLEVLPEIGLTPSLDARGANAPHVMETTQASALIRVACSC